MVSRTDLSPPAPRRCAGSRQGARGDAPPRCRHRGGHPRQPAPVEDRAEARQLDRGNDGGEKECGEIHSSSGAAAGEISLKVWVSCEAGGKRVLLGALHHISPATLRRQHTHSPVFTGGIHGRLQH